MLTISSRFVIASWCNHCRCTNRQSFLTHW